LGFGDGDPGVGLELFVVVLEFSDFLGMLGSVGLFVPCVQPLLGGEVVVFVHELAVVGASPVVDLQAVLVVEVSVSAEVVKSPLLGNHVNSPMEMVNDQK
jgi:hypothetical protein